MLVDQSQRIAARTRDPARVAWNFAEAFSRSLPDDIPSLASKSSSKTTTKFANQLRTTNAKGGA
ncbi:hypothetical protein K8I31_04685 [bacterium]|nr:hypothetical protein [bacterium]